MVSSLLRMLFNFKYVWDFFYKNRIWLYISISCKDIREAIILSDLIFIEKQQHFKKKSK